MSTPRRAQVLIVDDDDSVRHLERRLLIQGGYDVAEATSGAHALALINGGLSPDLVIADLDMPGLPGEVMVQRIRAARLQQKVLYVTGKIHRVLAIPPDMRAGDLFLDKPFTAKALLDAVGQVLAAPEERVAPRPALAVTDTKSAPSITPAALARDRLIKVLVVDDGDTHSAFIRFALPGTQFSVTVADVDDGKAAAAKESPDVIVVSARRLRPSALELCRQIKRSPQRLIPIVLVTADTDRRERMRAVDLGVDEFIGEPLDAAELVARVRVLTRVKRLTEEVDAFEESLVNIALAVEGRDPSTEGHCQRLARYAVALGEKMQLSKEDLSALSRGAYLHDIGKIVMPDSILLKPGALTRAEFSMMQTHPVVGERMCAGLQQN
jgi:response regulator RpfG family c-di-GMP phosphodiesterase